LMMHGTINVKTASDVLFLTCTKFKDRCLKLHELEN
jgi:hypothetical protein